MRVSFLTLGCKTNQAESSLLEASLRDRGWNIVDLKEKPDVCVINTCSVTAKTDYQSRQLIRRAGNVGSRVIVTGCYAELNKDFVSSMDGVSLVVGNSDKSNIVTMLAGEVSGDRLGSLSSDKSRLFIKVQDGCNGSCSYCIIPKARGGSRSIEPDDIVQRIRSVSSTYNEVVLTAIHLGTYGYDLNPKVILSSLVQRCLSYTSIRRIRLSSLEITEINEDLLELYQDDRLCKHVHVPLQSGDDTILGQMNRNYNSGYFSDKLLYIHRVLPSACIGTDVIAGFPGESEKAFLNTYHLLESLPISYMHVFPFSVRPGTMASQLKDRVDFSLIKDRCDQLRGLSRRKQTEYVRKQIGESLEVLVERTEGPGTVLGTTGNYLKARVFLTDATPKDLVAVRIAGVDNDVLLAYPI